MVRKSKETKGAEVPAAPTPMVRTTGGGPQRAATPEEQAQMQAQQRARTEVAVLKQRFAETDVAKTIAEAERDQLIQQLRASQQIIEQLTASLAEATKKPSTKKDDESTPKEE